jgi:hypothetical protein
MNGGDFMRATCEFTLSNASNPCIMVWDFQLDELNNPIDLTIEGADIVTALIARHYTPLAGALSNQLTMTAVSLRNFADLTDGFDVNGVLFVGSQTGPMLPPFVTLAIELLKGNFTMKNGRKAYPGPVVADVDQDGTVDSAVVASIADTTDIWATTSMVVEGSVDMTFYNRIVRVPVTPGINPTVFSNIIGYGQAYFGTQNTRK